MKLTNEQLMALKATGSVEEFAKLLKEYGVELAQEEIEANFKKMGQSAELSDEDLDCVAGGCGDDDDEPPQPTPAEQEHPKPNPQVM